VKEPAADGTPVAVTCRVLKIARAPYYRWLKLMLNTANLRVHASWDTETITPWWHCGPWLVARTRCSKRHAGCRG